MLLILFFTSTNTKAQEKFIFISTESAHITKDSYLGWFNTFGLRVGLEYAFKQPYTLYLDYGKLTYFDEDQSGSNILYSFITRGTITYRILRLGGYVGLFESGNVDVMLNLGGALRFRQQSYHNYYTGTGDETNTNELYSRTFYETSKDIGLVFGFICKYKINEKIHISTSVFTENYGDTRYKKSFDAESYSFISNQLTIHVKL